MPLIVELGVAFDVLVAAILFGVFFFHMSESFDTLDVDRLNRLSEVHETLFQPEEGSEEERP
jgi:hydrogenase-4 component E